MAHLVRFLDFILNMETGDLLRDNLLIPLRPQATKLLLEFLSHAGELLSRERIRQCICTRGTFTEFETSINSCVKQIRQALGDRPQSSRYIQTTARRGYRFIAPVHVIEPNVTEPAEPEPSEALPFLKSPIVLNIDRFMDLSEQPGVGRYVEALREEIIMCLTIYTGKNFMITENSNSGELAESYWKAGVMTHALRVSVRRNGAQLRVNARIVSAETGQVLQGWVLDQEFRRDLDTQLAIARKIAEYVWSELERCDRDSCATISEDYKASA
ncbi:MAG TPA: winged helix-turn-helix domain-containing protein [Candidatus Angelobacter sp.]|nr:winged helix-turn-helix domain-containing protein [Candidatus Angelobacter sp.]